MRVNDVALIGAAMGRLRAAPPTTLGGLAVETVDDLAVATAALPATEGLRFRLAHGARVVVRPSGTEPKLKCYLEVVVPVDGSPASARKTAADRLAAMRADLARALGI
jgi:phosphomannomutase